jgi:hypothetical protein
MSVKKQKSFKLVAVTALILVSVAYVAFSVWYILDLRKSNDSLNNRLQETSASLDQFKQDIITQPAQVIAKLQEETTKSVLEEVKKLYSVPEDENPTIATVQDIEKLKDQPFFDGAENGDVLIVFEKSSQAILYRPNENKLVKVGPISVDEKTAGTELAQPSKPESAE